MDNVRRWVRPVGYVALWLATAVLASALRSSIPPADQGFATAVAVVILAVFLVAIVVKQAKPMAQTLRGWRDQL